MKITPKKILGFFLIIIVIILIVAGYIANLFITVHSNPGVSQVEERQISIPQGSGGNEISTILNEAGIIDSKWDFELYLWMIKSENKIQAGEYRLRNNMSISEVVEYLTIGRVDNEAEIVIIEGWTISDIADYLEDKGIMKKDKFIEKTEDPEYFFQIAKDFPNVMDFLELSSVQVKNLEGYLFPDTYRVYLDSSAENIIYKMIDNLESKVTEEMLSELKNQSKPFYYVLTLASIVEKEVSKPEDRKKVADVFLKRLEAGMPLQADSTVNFATGKSSARSTLADTKVDNPYNTYKYKGLPPGPICNPSLDSINAVLFPDKNDYWYFLTTPGGEAVYSTSLEEHAEAKNKYY